MGSSQSSPAASQNPSMGSKFSGGRGRKSKSFSPGLVPSLVSLPSETLMMLKENDATHNTFDEADDDESTETDYSEAPDEVEDMDWEERLLVLEETRQLKKLADFFLHPERPVEPDTCGRCFFDRASAPDRLSKEESEERALILQQAADLKKSAVDFLHPELSVVTSDPTASARNYFSRASAPTATQEEAEDRASILKDAAMLKSLAVDYQHPELPVRSSGIPVRCYFDRESSPQFTLEESEERALIMEELKSLKQAAIDYLHPELPAAVTDPTACARCYFDRPSAPPQADKDEEEERQIILQEAAALKGLAINFLHPELPVRVDPIARTRCYFDRASAPEQISQADAEAKDEIMNDCKQLKSLAVDYFHPEKPVTTDGVQSRCYFDRASAPELESVEEAEERCRVLQDAKTLKQIAVDYLHPELPVTSEPTCFARCYFDRPSAVPQASSEDIVYRTQVLEDANHLKKLAEDFLHPELPVATSTAARCFFDRASAPDQLTPEEAEERASILEDAKALKAAAVQYFHPELPVVVSDTSASARCYFDRYSAPMQEASEDAEMRAQILADSRALKKLAEDYLHPEFPVVSSGNCARCYFDRFSAEQAETKEESDETASILAEAAALKKLAVDYLHPELPVTTVDATVSARCYYDRPSNRLHDQMVHSFPPHDDDNDDDHTDHHEHVDHFGLDEDFGFLAQVCDKLSGGEVNQSKVVNEDVESNLSRSPSSVMLFQEESIYD